MWITVRHLTIIHGAMILYWKSYAQQRLKQEIKEIGGEELGCRTAIKFVLLLGSKSLIR